MLMKKIFLIALLSTSAPAFSQNEAPVAPPAQTTDQPGTPTPAEAGESEEAKRKLAPNQQAFLNLSEEKRMDFVKYFKEASRLYSEKRIFEALDEIAKLDAVFADSPESRNLKASCYIEIRSFEKAIAELTRAVELSPDNPTILFNMAEVYFVTRDWQKSIDIFERLIKTKSFQTNIPILRLMEFKVMLAKKKLGKKEEAEALLKKYDDTDDSPYFYFAEASKAFDAGDVAKAEQFLLSASRVFTNPATITAWQDTFIEYGYLKSYYGGEDKSAVTEK